MSVRMRQSGFAYIAAVILLVVVAIVCAALLRLSSTSQATIDQNLLGARANLAARGGVEWGLYRLRTGACSTAPVTLNDFAAASGFVVTVTCTRRAFNEGEVANPDGSLAAVAKTVYSIDAIACNAAACPSTNAATVSQAGYVERRRVATACMVDADPAADC